MYFISLFLLFNLLMMSTEEIPTISASETGSQIVDTKEVDAQ
jgi:hypothetical protein